MMKKGHNNAVCRGGDEVVYERGAAEDVRDRRPSCDY